MIARLRKRDNTADMTGELPNACVAALGRHLRPGLFKALCDAKRLELLARLITESEPITVSEAATCCGVHISGVSRHLAILRDAGVVRAEKRGREVTYQLDCDALVSTLRALADAIEDCRAQCCSAKQQDDEEEENLP